MGLQVKHGTMQDATFISLKPTPDRHINLVAKMPRLVVAVMERGLRKELSPISAINCIKNRSRLQFDSTNWDETTTASVHDSQIDLSVEDEIVLRDRGYFGAKAEGIDSTMKRRTIETVLGILDKHRNRLISRLRAPGARPHAVIKRVFGAGRVLVTTVRRVHVELMVTAFAYNLYQLCTLKKAKVF